MKTFKKWYNDTKEREFNILNSEGANGISKVRKLVDMHSHAFDFAYDQPYQPNIIRVVISPSEPKPSSKASPATNPIQRTKVERHFEPNQANRSSV